MDKRSLFGPMEYKYLHKSLRNLVDRTPMGAVGDTPKYRCDKHDGRVYVSAKVKDGRCGSWVEVWMD